jgi:Ni/Co efflux regulator RcnB
VHVLGFGDAIAPDRAGPARRQEQKYEESGQREQQNAHKPGLRVAPFILRNDSSGYRESYNRYGEEKPEKDARKYIHHTAPCMPRM